MNSQEDKATSASTIESLSPEGIVLSKDELTRARDQVQASLQQGTSNPEIYMAWTEYLGVLNTALSVIERVQKAASASTSSFPSPFAINLPPPKL